MIKSIPKDYRYYLRYYRVETFSGWVSMLLLVLASVGECLAQQFISRGRTLTDFDTSVRADSIPIRVDHLPTRIDAEYGLMKVCFNIQHSRTSDLKIELVAPSGQSIWLSNRNGGDQGADFANTCFRSNGFSGYIHQASAPFAGEYSPDGRFRFLNDGQNPNGTWYLLITDLRKGEGGVLTYVTLEFGANPMPNDEKTPCSFQNPAACRCSTDRSDCQLLPDLVIIGSFTRAQIKEYAWNDPTYPGQLRFAASIANIGDGPMETVGNREWYCQQQRVDSGSRCADGTLARQRLYQRVYSRQADSLSWHDYPAGTNYFDEKPGHNHYHADDWVEFRLVQRYKTRNGREAEKVVATGRKVSYCLFDSGICRSSDTLCQDRGITYGPENLANYGLGSYASCQASRQGISVGGYDTYGMMYEGQYIQLPKGLKSGTYWLEIVIDPEGQYREKSRANNRFTMPVRISRQQ
ncbi:proprotein convertase P-domain-containing protein [Spirosoma sordidisoli]|nr:proprotein convertase P-domain-containing protein [Spirosoma sordidisoli]